MNLNSWEGARQAEQRTYPVRLWMMELDAASSTALMYPKDASWPSISVELIFRSFRVGDDD